MSVPILSANGSPKGAAIETDDFDMQLLAKQPMPLLLAVAGRSPSMGIDGTDKITFCLERFSLNSRGR